MASLSHCARVAVLDLDMSVEVGWVSRSRGRIFLSLPSSVAQGVSLFVWRMLFINSIFIVKLLHNYISL